METERGRAIARGVDSPGYSPPPSDDEGSAAPSAARPGAAAPSTAAPTLSLRHRALLACAPRDDNDPRPCPLTKSGLTALARRDPAAYAALRQLSQDALPTPQELPGWCSAGGGCDAPCNGTRSFGLAEMMRHAKAKAGAASQLSDGGGDDDDDDDDDEPPVGPRLHAIFFAVLSSVDPSRKAPTFEVCAPCSAMSC